MFLLRGSIHASLTLITQSLYHIQQVVLSTGSSARNYFVRTPYDFSSHRLEAEGQPPENELVMVRRVSPRDVTQVILGECDDIS